MCFKIFKDFQSRFDIKLGMPLMHRRTHSASSPGTVFPSLQVWHSLNKLLLTEAHVDLTDSTLQIWMELLPGNFYAESDFSTFSCTVAIAGK